MITTACLAMYKVWMYKSGYAQPLRAQPPSQPQILPAMS